MRFISLRGEERRTFLQTKYNFFKEFSLHLLSLLCVMCTLFFVVDCSAVGGFSSATLIPRLSIMALLGVFYVIYKRISNTTVVSIAVMFVIHLVLLFSLIAISRLPDTDFARELFIVIQIAFLLSSCSAPYECYLLGHLIFIADLYLSNMLLHYPKFEYMISINFICMIVVIILAYIFNEFIFQIYTQKRSLESSLAIDPLTKLYNRNIIPTLVKDGLFKFDRTGVVSVLMADIDYFKNINDSYGHEKGDVVLQDISNILQSCTRGNDYVIRWGGEEFVIIMPNCNLTEAANVAERIRNNIESYESSVTPLTISIGVADYDNINYENVINQADKALYVAKQTGRNKVVTYSKGTTTEVLTATKG